MGPVRSRLVSGSNTYTGPTTVTLGTLQAGATNSLPFNSPITLTNTAGVVLDLNGFNNTILNLSSGATATPACTVMLGANTLTFGDATNQTFGGIITGVGGGLTKQGSGTFTLAGSGVNTYSGPTTIVSGLLQSFAVNALSPNSTIVLANTAGVGLDILYNTTSGSLSGGGLLGGNINLNSAVLTAGDATSTTYAGVMSAGGGFGKQGTGTQTLTGANTYSGNTTVGSAAASGGTLLIGASGSLPSTTNVTIYSPSILALGDGFTQSINSLLGIQPPVPGTDGELMLGSANPATTLTITGVMAQTFGGMITGSRSAHPGWKQSYFDRFSKHL